MIPHPDSHDFAVNCAVITVSDTRTSESDRSGQIIQQLLQNAGHQISIYTIVKDEPVAIQELLEYLEHQFELEAIIFTGGTGIAPRDTTYDVVSNWLTKIIPGFGEIFRYLSYQKIGSRAIASRAVAGVKNQKVVFSLPGSANAVELAVSKLILPELNHLIKQVQDRK
ncbi:MAG: MogA/MoaB family molybdenum cofactor biosynthesis protein [Pleurocapsa sp. SU_5_0]|nr:MogA/MoaB family molybdenum cofactor biosynthesis protein [Pleurocapsa sp. SU_5_0]NJO98972.1 MogA/MoaB family molybdenum cofactor biosynthesis protein [Pleurocapsa sp. CRU_1_2]NJR48143.1 MogA/MoaB family molybdenum cofactor biosynthesis protein [Hyellaceae cyanobacterium CSU_1_1]